MSRGKSYLDVNPGPGAGHPWLSATEAAPAQPGDKLKTMSDETRAAVLRAAGGKPAKADEPGDNVQALIALMTETFRLHGRLLTLYSTVKDTVGLTGMESLTLFAIVQAGAPVTVPQIGRSLGHARQVVQRATRTLEERGLVETRPNPGHKRAAFVVATETGRKLKQGVDAAGEAISRSLASELDVVTLERTTRVLQHLRHEVEARQRKHGGS
jgi:DNA-binding MarR family transcriptional regulator